MSTPPQTGSRRDGRHHAAHLAPLVDDPRAWVLDLLFDTGSAAAGPSTPTDRTEGYLLLPRTRPRLAIPTSSPEHARAGLLGWPGSRRGRLLRGAAATLGLPGADRLLRRAGVTAPASTGHSLLRHLADALPDTHSLAVRLGTVRPNSKPVLQLTDANAAVTGFAKVGWNELTTRLVRHEAARLRAVSGAPRDVLRLPTVRTTTTWRGHEIVVLSPVASRPDTSAPATDALTATLQEIATLDGPPTTSSLAESHYLRALRARTTALAHRPAGRRADDALQEIVTANGETGLQFATWHGDFTPWNVAAHGAGVAVWDWERSHPATPVGFDAIHYHLRPGDLAGASDPWAAARAAADRADPLLRALGVERSAIDLVTALYLIELAVRQVEGGSATPASTRLQDAALTAAIRHQQERS